MGRTQKAAKNVATGLLNKIMMMLLAFATKTIFIRLLGAEYNGVSSLYTNILSVLALAELGVGNVLMFYLYSALEKKDEEKTCALVYEFKKIYNAIIVCVLAVGLALVPFLQYLVNSTLDGSELIVYYLLYLMNSVASYFVVFRTTVIRADQGEYILNNVSTGTTVVMYLLQIAYLSLNRDFLGYLVIQLACTILSNLIQNHLAIKRYPYLRKKSKVFAEVDRRSLFQNVKATFLFKISDTILDQTDNIIISIMFGTVMVGMYSNYYLLVVYLVNIAGIIANGMVASFGNLFIENNGEKNKKMFRVSMLLFSLYGTFCSTCYMCLIQDFIPIWVGEQYLMDFDLVMAVIVVFYLRMSTNTIWIYRASMGLFKEVQYVNLVAAFLNIGLSILLGKKLGVAGVIVATACSRLLTSFWYEGKIVLEKMGASLWEYLRMQLKDLLLFGIIAGISLWLTQYVSATGVLGVALKAIICTVIFGAIEIIVRRKDPAMGTLIHKIKALKKA